MLVITRKYGECIAVETPLGIVLVRVLGKHGRRVTLGIDAPREWPIHNAVVSDTLGLTE